MSDVERYKVLGRKEVKKHFAETKMAWVHYEKDFWSKLRILLKYSDKIVDLGCGAGDLSIKLKKDYNVNDITMVDLDDYRRKQATKFPLLKVDLCMQPIPIKSSSVDVIFALQAFEHLENPHHFVRECHRILKKKGIFIMSIPNGWNFFSRLSFLFKGSIQGFHKPDTNHICFLPKNIFNRLFNNFEVLDSLYSKRKRGVFFPFRHFDLPYPRSELFSRKVCYFFQKING